MVTIPTISLVSITLGHFVNTRPLVVDLLLLYPWIIIPLVNQNRGTLVPPL